MGTWAALGAGGRAVIMGLGGVTAVGLGYVALREAPPVPEPVAAVEEPAVVAAPADVVVEPVAEPVAEPVVEAPVVAAPVVAAPPAELTVDTWRVAADGAATVAGRAVPDAAVKVLVDGAEVAATKATGSGEYAVLFTLAPNPSPSLMTLVAVAPDGAELALKAAIALGPVAGPVEVAAAEVAEAAVAEAPAAVMLTDEGAVVLQDAADAPVADAGPVAVVVIDTIAYTPGGAVQLGGKAQPGAFLRFYLDNAPLQTVLVPDSGLWLTTLKDTPPGIYTLRADQLDDAGKVTSRFETPFKRESLEALAVVAAGEVEAPVEEPVVEARVNDAVVVAEAPVAEAEVVAEGAVVVPETGEPTIRPAQEDAPVVAVEEPEEAAEVVAEAPAEVAPEPAPEVAPVEVAVAEVEVAEVAEPVVEPAPVVEPEPVAVAELLAEPVAAAVTVTVQPGFTLWGIAEGQMGDGVRYVQVFEANKDKIKDPDLIYPGQVFTIPAEE